jgi:hypothetical protein
MYQELWRPLLADLSKLHPRPPFVLIPRKRNKKAVEPNLGLVTGATICAATLGRCRVTPM